MRRRSIRRGQLIAPFGPGAMLVTPDGTSLIAAGLDHWYPSSSPGRTVDPSEFKFGEWRLQEELKVDYFGLPPDFRPVREWADKTNTRLTVPFLRFPQWHVCPVCQRLERVELVRRDSPKCPACQEKVGTKLKRPPNLVQVRFVALCDQGHIQDFPWREWAHGSANPNCEKPMRLVARGEASLAGTRVECECEKGRSLEGITGGDTGGTSAEDEEAGTESSYLTKNLALDTKAPYLCPGRRPWLGDDEPTQCDRPLRGSLRGATNVYYSLVRSSIYLPRRNDAAPPDLMQKLEKPEISAAITLIQQLGGKPTGKQLKAVCPTPLVEFTEEQVDAALQAVDLGKTTDTAVAVGSDDDETRFRRSEYLALEAEQREDELRSTPLEVGKYDARLGQLVRRVALVEKLRETRAFTGFTRVHAEDNRGLEARKDMLWRDRPTNPPHRWLPAYIVRGEGIYIEFADENVRTWERRSAVRERINTLDQNFLRERQNRRLPPRRIQPRLVLLHTIAHLLMNQLTFECGYSSAALRERLYVSNDQFAPMAGILIYTAAGDSEGTLGGLVRMGKPGSLEPVIIRAIERARWCSADPVCMELGDIGGQGPGSCNLAACHNCALVPETSCEEFNRFLDRALLIGTPEEPEIGFVQFAESASVMRRIPELISKCASS